MKGWWLWFERVGEARVIVMVGLRGAGVSACNGEVPRVRVTVEV